MSHIIVWEFLVREGHELGFEEVYGPRGAWAALFGRSPEFCGTELLRDRSTPRRYLTLDRWTTADAFEEFKRSHAADYDALDTRCEAWTERELRIGAWMAPDAPSGSAVEHHPIDSHVHHDLLDGIVLRGYAPTRDELGESLGVAPQEIDASLRRLHENHGLVLHPETASVWVAHPFSLSPTAVSVATDKRIWWAPCIWCAMGIVTLCASSAEIHARLGGETEELTIRVRDGKLLDDELVVHFPFPPRDAWKNVFHYCANVLPFRCEEDRDAWCVRHRMAKGALVPVGKVYELGRAWYGRHLAADWVKWTPEQAQAIFQSVGLAGEFWALPGGEGHRF